MIQTILFNGSIITLDETRPKASALAISYGRAVALGSDAEITRLAGSATVMVNLDGKTVLPGLADAHLHWEGQARSLRSVDVFEVPSKAIALDRVRRRVEELDPGQWLTGRGWAQDLWPERAFPSKHDLDGVAPDNPALLIAKSGHAAWVNSAALQLAGIGDSRPDPPGGQILRDEQGRATGILLESAIELARAALPEPGGDELADMMLEAQNEALACGITMIHDFDDPGCLAALQILRERGQLGLRVLKQINQAWLDAAIDSGLRTGFGDDWIRIGGLKLFADGALGPRTALMFEPYAGEPDNYGLVVVDKEDMVEQVSRASRHGLPSSIHAIGDKAVHDALDVFASVRHEERERGQPPSSRRHRIEHVQIIHPRDVTRLAELDVIASMQPIHATSDMQTADRYWGARTRYAYNPRIQLDQGARVAFGSDAPVEPVNPWLGIHAAVTRQRAGQPAPGWHPSARLTLRESLLGFTRGAAYAAGMDDRLGKLADGFLADLIVLQSDVFAMPADELAGVKPVGAMVDGVWRFREFD